MATFNSLKKNISMIMEKKISQSELFHSNENVLSVNNNYCEDNIHSTLNDLIERLTSTSESELFLDEINKILASNFIQTVIYSYLQVSMFKKLKEHLSIEDEDLNRDLEHVKWSSKSVSILKLTIKLLAIICERAPSNIQTFDHLVDRIEIILDVLNDELLSHQFLTTVYEIKNGFLERQINEKNGKKILENVNIEPPENFREISVIPSLEEITSSNGLFLRSNLKFGPFDSVEHYLDVHFRLLREDYVGSLREGVLEYLAINQIQKHKQSSSNTMFIRSYKNVKILNYITDANSNNPSIYHLIKFEMTNSLKRIRWQTSKRLIQGSLVCLTSDNFKTVYFAVIFERNVKMLNEGQILVKFENWISISSKIQRDPKHNGGFIMIETLAYFESYRYTLESLKLFNAENFPFSKYIIFSQNDEIYSPKYLRSGTDCLCYDFKPIIKDLIFKNEFSSIDILQLQLWPNSRLLGLNESQYKALQLALTKELVVIQGPPGTGILKIKSHIFKHYLNYTFF